MPARQVSNTLGKQNLHFKNSDGLVQDEVFQHH